MREFRGGLNFRLHGDIGLKNFHRWVTVCVWLGIQWLILGFSLALTLCELSSLFVSSQNVYTFDC